MGCCESKVEKRLWNISVDLPFHIINIDKLDKVSLIKLYSNKLVF